MSYYIENGSNNKVPLYSIENYIQYPMINHNGKDILKKEYICMYVCMYNWITFLYRRNQHNIINKMWGVCVCV